MLEEQDEAQPPNPQKKIKFIKDYIAGVDIFNIGT